MLNQQATFRFRLYVAGEAPNSLRAIANLAALCNEYLADRNVVEIVDVFKQPKRALADGIFMTPTLVKPSPKPVRTIVGSLSDFATVLRTLGLGPGR